jgi:hypothetical protein
MIAGSKLFGVLRIIAFYSIQDVSDTRNGLRVHPTNNLFVLLNAVLKHFTALPRASSWLLNQTNRTDEVMN